MKKKFENAYKTIGEVAKDLNLRGVPTTILFNKKGEEFARIIGSIDFDNKKFIDWIKTYN